LLFLPRLGKKEERKSNLIFWEFQECMVIINFENTKCKGNHEDRKNRAGTGKNLLHDCHNPLLTTCEMPAQYLVHSTEGINS
jgi:hypothetical protein